MRVRMIPFLRDNSVVFLGLLSWFIAQLIKFIIEVSTHRRINWRRFFESGGMPSSHSAFVCSIAMGIGFREGFASSFFALAFMIAMVVMYDAMGVRRETGEQAKILNRMLTDWMEAEAERTPILADKKLKEMVGHTPFEVLGGAIVGIAVGFLIPIF